MQRVEELLGKYERVWFYVSEEWRETFYEELLKINARFRDGSCITHESIREFMGVGSDGTVGYVSYMIWYSSFENPSRGRIKVDYGKFRSSEKGYFIDTNIKVRL